VRKGGDGKGKETGFLLFHILFHSFFQIRPLFYYFILKHSSLI
jgi:hypothetical protein